MKESITTFNQTDLGELQGKLRDALDLGLAGGAPLSLLERLGASNALIAALNELPKHALIPEVVGRAHRALGAWDEWQQRARRTIAA